MATRTTLKGYFQTGDKPTQSEFAELIDGVPNLTDSSVSDAEFAQLNGVTSPIQTQIDGKQATLVNQTNIKSVNGETLLGSGDLTVSSSAAWGGITGTLSSQTDLQTALDAKEDVIAAGTTAQYYRGDKTFRDLDKTAVGLPNVDNTSDANKPVSTATQTELDEKQDTISLTTTGTSGVATFVGATLNVPDYGSAASSVAWGDITGTLSNQTDLDTALDLKADLTGATFTGAVSATNLSGTNTGDQDISGIATNTTAISTKLSTTGGAMTGAITGNIAITGFRPYLRETTTARTLSLSDAGTFISAENEDDPTTVTIPTNASVAFTAGTEIDFIQKTVQTLTLTAAAGVTLNGAVAGSVEVTAQWGGVTIKKIAEDEWIAVGKI